MKKIIFFLLFAIISFTSKAQTQIRLCQPQPRFYSGFQDDIHHLFKVIDSSGVVCILNNDNDSLIVFDSLATIRVLIKAARQLQKQNFSLNDKFRQEGQIIKRVSENLKKILPLESDSNNRLGIK